MKRGTVLLAVAIAVGGGLWLIWIATTRGSRPHAADPPSALTVRVAAATQESGYTVQERFAGRVVSRRTSDLGFERGGRVAEVFVDEGDRVEAGTRIAVLDTRGLRARRRELEAQVEQIRADLALARVTTGRRTKLHGEGHLSSQELDDSVYRQAAFEAGLAAASASVESIDVQLDLSVLRAPYAGIIDARFVDEGTVVSAGLPVVRLNEDDALEVRVGVPPKVAEGLARESKYDLEVDAGTIPAVVQAVLSSVNQDTRTVTVVFRLVGEHVPARNGALARFLFERRLATKGFWLPLEALAESHRGLWSAYVARPTDPDAVWKVERRQVEVVHTDGERAFVRGTLVNGDLVVVGGVHRLVPGQRVRIAREMEGAR